MNSRSFSHIGEVAIAPRTEENDGRQGYYFPTATTGERPSYSQQPDPEDRMTAGGGGAVRSGSDFGEKIGHSHSMRLPRKVSRNCESGYCVIPSQSPKQEVLEAFGTSVGYYESVALYRKGGVMVAWSGRNRRPGSIPGSSIAAAHESAEERT